MHFLKRIAARLMGLTGVYIKFAAPSWAVRFGDSVSVFKSRKIIYSDSRGYYYLHPPVTPAELAEYYSSRYWIERGDGRRYITPRDVQHLGELVEYSKGKSSTPNSSFFDGKIFLNFGSGHGGVSHLMHALGANVVNIEPSGDARENSHRWSTFRCIEDYVSSTNEKIDIFYSSHSLEHVPDIEDLLDVVKGMIEDSTIFFFEVPDGASPGNGAQLGIHDVPHTYYYTKKFFQSVFSEIHSLYTLTTECKSLTLDAALRLKDRPYDRNQRGVIRCLALRLR